MAMPDFNNQILQLLQPIYGRTAAEGSVQEYWRTNAAAADTEGNLRLAKTVGSGILSQGATTGASYLIGVAAPISNVATGTGVAIGGTTVGSTINPVIWAIKPWLAAKDVANIAWSLEKVYAVMNEENGTFRRKYRCEEYYPCTCRGRQHQSFVFWRSPKQALYNSERRDGGHMDCQAVRDFLKDQKDAKAAKIAINATVVGAPFYMLYSAGRSIYKRVSGTIHKARSQAAQHLIRSAMPTVSSNRAASAIIDEHGCRRAQALIALLLGELNLKHPNGNIINYPLTMAALTHPDGWYSLSSAFSAALIADTPAFLQKKGL